METPETPEVPETPEAPMPPETPTPEALVDLSLAGWVRAWTFEVIDAGSNGARVEATFTVDEDGEELSAIGANGDCDPATADLTVSGNTLSFEITLEGAACGIVDGSEVGDIIAVELMVEGVEDIDTAPKESPEAQEFDLTGTVTWTDISTTDDKVKTHTVEGMVSYTQPAITN